MKKILSYVFCIFIISNLFAEVLNEKPVYKTFAYKGKEESFWAVALDIEEYNSLGQLIYTKTTGDLYSFAEPRYVETWYEYDNKGNNIYKYNSYGNECWMDYDSNGNLVHERWSTGIEANYEYNSKGQLIHSKDVLGEDWLEYDYNGNMIHLKSTSKREEWHDYNSANQEIHYRFSDGFEGWYDYDEKGYRVHFKNNSGFEHWYTNNSAGQEIRYLDSNGNECLHEYDDKGQETYVYNFGFERWTEYEYFEDGITLKRKTIYKPNTKY